MSIKLITMEAVRWAMNHDWFEGYGETRKGGHLVIYAKAWAHNDVAGWHEERFSSMDLDALRAWAGY